ncbi:cryptococcal mannosyltransferase 1-domain-containing protein [Truncatella angustata]|uniref:Cryptococcal mannosyltransferase 1-domain-containing protein n=1 Tax=Truncatella angustata TaxID=152316 RepID=A0A9P8RER2_9PEZI|nr:cryptococcal mannosyltransferase 1-domain-containing protein [Truncatella angustata]KAH6643248.1 cryptococcal mannosyltransferase 1-domain-containing protein [Truncatella angustata]
MNQRLAAEKRVVVPHDDSAGGSRDLSSDYSRHWNLTPRKFRRLIRNVPIFKLVKYILVLVVVLAVATPILAPSYTNPPPQYRELNARCAGASPNNGCGNPFEEKVFISVSLYDKNGHLASGSWGKALLELINLLGPDNVFLSIYENDSGNDGARALEGLKERLPCRHRIVNDAHVSLDGFPTIVMPDGTERVKRLAYLSEIRNRALRPLDTLDETELGVGPEGFDKILFLNDVDFHPTDAANLLFSTNLGHDGRANYLAACGLDFMQPLLFYDLYAQRDAEGYSGGIPIFPFFTTEGQGLSRAAILAQSDAVPVRSCWGGIVAMQARYVQNLNKVLPTTNFQEIGSHVINPAVAQIVTAPVRFRNEPEIFFDACECCLFLADVSQAAKSMGAQELGTYVNPYVRVAYSQSTLGWLRWVRRWERLFVIPQWLISKIVGLPTHNPHRTVQQGEPFTEEIWTGPQPGSWQLTERTGRNGLFCGVREMQLVQTGGRTTDKNWENNKMPPGQILKFPT